MANATIADTGITTISISMDPWTLIALIISIIAIVPLLIFFIARSRYVPRVEFRFPLTRDGDIYIIPTGQLEIVFNLHGHGTKDIIVEWVKVCSNPFEITILPSQLSLFPTVMTGYNDKRFFRALEIRPDERVLFVTGDSMIGYGYRFGSTMRDQLVREFELKFVARTRIDRVRIPFLLDMFDSKEIDYEKIYKFRVAS